MNIKPQVFRQLSILIGSIATKATTMFLDKVYRAFMHRLLMRRRGIETKYLPEGHIDLCFVQLCDLTGLGLT